MSTDFTTSAKAKHGDIYDYSRVEYISQSQNVKIICSEHGQFSQTPIEHLSGGICPACKTRQAKQQEAKQQPVTNAFIQTATMIHGDKYNYSKTVYIDKTTPVCIISVDGEFYQTPEDHIENGVNPGIEYKPCDYVLYKDSKNTNNFVQRATLKHGDKYTYFKSVYNGDTTKLRIKCNIHGVYMQKPIAHLLNDDDCVTCLQQAEERTQYLASRTPEEKRRTELCLFTISSIEIAGVTGYELKPHRDDAREFLTGIETLLTAFTTVRHTFLNSGAHSGYNINDNAHLETARNRLRDMLHNDPFYMTAKTEFRELYTRCKNDVRDPQYSVVKKIVELYDEDTIMSQTTCQIIAGILRDYLSDITF